MAALSFRQALGGSHRIESSKEQAMAILTIEKNAVDGPFTNEVVARVAAHTGEPDRGIRLKQLPLVDNF